MSPEQVAAGSRLDHRTDIFAFGAILYEMLTGRRAFQGRTAADTMTAVLREDPRRSRRAAAGCRCRPRASASSAIAWRRTPTCGCSRRTTSPSHSRR